MRAKRPNEAGTAVRPATPGAALCVETQSRAIMAVLVHDVVADAMRLGLHDAASEPLNNVDGVRLQPARRPDRIANG